MKISSFTGFWGLASLLVVSKVPLASAQLCSSSSDCDIGNNCCLGLCWSTKCLFGNEKEQGEASGNTAGVYCSSDIECAAHSQVELLADGDEVHCCSGQCMTQTKCDESGDRENKDIQVVSCSTNFECQQHANFAVFVDQEDTYCCHGECMQEQQCKKSNTNMISNAALAVTVLSVIIGGIFLLIIVPIAIFFSCKLCKGKESRTESGESRVNVQPPFVRYSANPPEYERNESDFSSFGSQSVIQDAS